MDLPSADYLKRVDARSELLVRRSLIARESAKRTGRMLVQGTTDLSKEFEQLREQMRLLDDDLRRCVVRVRDVVTRFHGVASARDVQRVAARIDAWAPDRMMPRDAFQRDIAR